MTEKKNDREWLDQKWILHTSITIFKTSIPPA